MDRFEKQILEAFANLVHKKVSLHSVVLFGSRTKGKGYEI